MLQFDRVAKRHDRRDGARARTQRQCPLPAPVERAEFVPPHEAPKPARVTRLRVGRLVVDFVNGAACAKLWRQR